MNERLTRKDIKRDDFTAAMGRGVEYAGSHVRNIAYAIGGILLLVALGIAIHFYRANRLEEANHALAGAMKVYQAPVTATGAKPADPDEPSFATDAARRTRAKELLKKVHDDYGSTDAGAVASLYLAQIAADEGRLDEARKLWSDYADDHEGTHARRPRRGSICSPSTASRARGSRWPSSCAGCSRRGTRRSPRT